MKAISQVVISMYKHIYVYVYVCADFVQTVSIWESTPACGVNGWKTIVKNSFVLYSLITSS